MDFSFIEHQTFGDHRLESELLELFLAQARRLVPELLTCGPQARDEAAHLLKGSALAIGANRVATAVQAFANALPGAAVETDPVYREVVAAMGDAEQKICLRLEALRQRF